MFPLFTLWKGLQKEKIDLQWIQFTKKFTNMENTVFLKARIKVLAWYLVSVDRQ